MTPTPPVLLDYTTAPLSQIPISPRRLSLFGWGLCLYLAAMVSLYLWDHYLRTPVLRPYADPVTDDLPPFPMVFILVIGYLVCTLIALTGIRLLTSPLIAPTRSLKDTLLRWSLRVGLTLYFCLILDVYILLLKLCLLLLILFNLVPPERWYSNDFNPNIFAWHTHTRNIIVPFAPPLLAGLYLWYLHSLFRALPSLRPPLWLWRPRFRVLGFLLLVPILYFPIQLFEWAPYNVYVFVNKCYNAAYIPYLRNILEKYAVLGVFNNLFDYSLLFLITLPLWRLRRTATINRTAWQAAHPTPEPTPSASSSPSM